MIRRLLGAVVDGIGLSAGAKIFHEAASELEKSLPPEESEPQREQRLKREAAAAAREAEKRAKEAEKARKQFNREVDDELAALKKKAARER